MFEIDVTPDTVKNIKNSNRMVQQGELGLEKLDKAKATIEQKFTTFLGVFLLVLLSLIGAFVTNGIHIRKLWEIMLFYGIPISATFGLFLKSTFALCPTDWIVMATYPMQWLPKKLEGEGWSEEEEKIADTLLALSQKRACVHNESILKEKSKSLTLLLKLSSCYVILMIIIAIIYYCHPPSVHVP